MDRADVFIEVVTGRDEVFTPWSMTGTPDAPAVARGRSFAGTGMPIDAAEKQTRCLATVLSRQRKVGSAPTLWHRTIMRTKETGKWADCRQSAEILTPSGSPGNSKPRYRR